MIRPYRESDSLRCCEIINRSLGSMDGLNDAARALVISKNNAEQLNSELRSLYAVVAEDSGGIVGVGALHGAEIKRVYVDPDCQGSGIGTALMTDLETEARRRGMVEVFVDSSPSARSFYAHLGYRGDNVATITRGDAEFTCVKMWKRCQECS